MKWSPTAPDCVGTPESGCLARALEKVESKMDVLKCTDTSQLQQRSVYAALAAINSRVPRRLMTRLMLYASIVRLISERTFSSPRVRKWP